MRKEYLVVLFIVFLIALAGCAKQERAEDLIGGGSDVAQQTQEQQEIKEPEVEETSELESGEEGGTLEEELPVKEFSMTAFRFGFDPDTITVNQGDLVRIRATSTDVRHGISIPQFGVLKNINPGRETVIEFIADEQGTFQFYCSVYCGSGHGRMKGTLIVE